MRLPETIIRSPDCSLGPVPDAQNSSLGLVPVSIIDVWDWSQRGIFNFWDQINTVFIWSQPYKMSLWDQSQTSIMETGTGPTHE